MQERSSPTHYIIENVVQVGFIVQGRDVTFKANLCDEKTHTKHYSTTNPTRKIHVYLCIYMYIDLVVYMYMYNTSVAFSMDVSCSVAL